MSDEPLNLLHVVRRYGPVGGMERYVWELMRELAALGHRVTVVCERCPAERPHGIEVHELGEIAPRPRWLEENPHPGWLVHSHERLAMHLERPFTQFAGGGAGSIY